MIDAYFSLASRRRRAMRPLAGLAITFVALGTALAVETQTLRDDTFADFNQGVSTGTELLADGRVQPGPRAILREKSDEGVIWDIAVDHADGTVFYATGHSGKVFRLQKNGKLDLWADLAEVQATALAIDPKGGLLIGASPGGKIYRVTEKGKPQLFFETKEKYVWDMIFDRNGMLYAATGTEGRIFRIRAERNGEVYYDSEATNVMDLAFDSSGNLLAATQGKGYVLRVSEPNNGYVLYASSQDEVRALTVDAHGNIYAAANASRVSSVLDKTTTGTFGSSLTGKAQIVQVQPSGFVANFLAVPEGPVHDLLADDATSSVLIAAGNNGKIYRASIADGNYSVAADVDEPLVTALAAGDKGALIGTANKAVVYELETSAPLTSGLFASRAHNAKSTVQWGNLVFDGEIANEDDLLIETRGGNTPEPTDSTWSRWTEAEQVAPNIRRIATPVSQYLQYRITLKPGADETVPFIDSVQVFYVEKNAPPVLKKIEVAKVAGNPAAAAAAAAAVARLQREAENKSDESSEDAARLARAAQAAASQNASKATLQNSQKLNITWSAEDPNNDRLRYDLYYKGEDEAVWKLIEEHMTAVRHQFSTEAIPDGQYRFRVEATDRFDNQETSASTVSMTSRVFTVDNSSPEISDITARKNGSNTYEITATATDKTSIISAAEYNLNAADEWRTLAPQDGIFDFHTEKFQFSVTPEKEQAEHTLSIRVYDREGNSRVEKILLR